MIKHKLLQSQIKIYKHRKIDFQNTQMVDTYESGITGNVLCAFWNKYIFLSEQIWVDIFNSISETILLKGISS